MTMSNPQNGVTRYSWRHEPLLWIYSFFLLIPFIMAFFFYNYHQLWYCLYGGISILIIGSSIILLAGYEFKMKGETPKGESIVHTTSLVDTGVYSVIRHPQYLGFILFVYGLVLISQHRISIISGTIGTALFYLDIVKEEEMSIAKFGTEYTDYMKRVPRLNFFIGIFRLLKRGRKNEDRITDSLV